MITQLRSLAALLSLGVVLAAFDSCTDAGGDTADAVASHHNLTGKVVIVTGGDGGLGFSVVQSLAARRATVILASHNLNKTEAAAAVVRAAGGDARAMHLDLSLLSSVRDFATKFGQDFDRLDLLINNAGISGPTKDYNTADGFEATFQVDYLGHFLLTELLLPMLRNSSARVVNVASTYHSEACQMSGQPNDCLKDWSNFPPKVVTGKAWKLAGTAKTNYGLAKFFNIQHAKQLAVLEPSIQAYSICPGLVNTSINNQTSFATWLFCKLPKLPPQFENIVWPQSTCPYQPQQGAAVIDFAALSATAMQNGEWFTRYSGCKAGNVTMNGFTEAMRPELYKRSLQLVGLNASNARNSD